jgi:hypothetical protein
MEKSENVKKKTMVPGRAGSGAFRLSIGRALLMLCTLSMLSQMTTLQSELIEENRNSSWMVLKGKSVRTSFSNTAWNHPTGKFRLY